MRKRILVLRNWRCPHVVEERSLAGPGHRTIRQFELCPEGFDVRVERITSSGRERGLDDCREGLSKNGVGFPVFSVKLLLLLRRGFGSRGFLEVLDHILRQEDRQHRELPLCIVLLSLESRDTVCPTSSLLFL